MTAELVFTLLTIPFILALAVGILGVAAWGLVVLWWPWKGDW